MVNFVMVSGWKASWSRDLGVFEIGKYISSMAFDGIMLRIVVLMEHKL